MNSNIIFILVLVFVATSEAKSKNKWTCNKADRKSVDKLVANIMTYGRVDVKFPENKAELKAYCKREYKMIAKLQDYKEKCLKAQVKQIVGVIVYSMKNAMNQYCRGSKPKKGIELADSGRCANNLTQEYLGCNNEYTDLMMALWNSTDSKQRLGQMCCGYVDIFKCVERNARPNPHCTDQHVETHKQFVRGFFENAVSVVCRDYNEYSDACDNFIMVRLPNKTIVERPESYFGPLVHNLANL